MEVRVGARGRREMGASECARRIPGRGGMDEEALPLPLRRASRASFAMAASRAREDEIVRIRSRISWAFQDSSSASFAFDAPFVFPPVKLVPAAAAEVEEETELDGVCRSSFASRSPSPSPSASRCFASRSCSFVGLSISPRSFTLPDEVERWNRSPRPPRCSSLARRMDWRSTF
jgi:hypothetical protein